MEPDHHHHHHRHHHHHHDHHHQGGARPCHAHKHQDHHHNHHDHQHHDHHHQGGARPADPRPRRYQDVCWAGSAFYGGGEYSKFVSLLIYLILDCFQMLLIKRLKKCHPKDIQN